MKIYNKLCILWVICGIAFTANAQPGSSNDQRTVETRIADTAMQLPAKDTETLNRLMRELIQLDNVVSLIAPRLQSPGQGDDSQLRAVVSGLAFYASQGNNPAERRKIAEGLCKGIQDVASEEVKDFLFIQLQYVAGNESLETAARYLENARLSDAAARVLIRIGGDDVGRALLNAGTRIKVLSVSTVNQERTIIEALGAIRYRPALEYITSAVNSLELRKTALRSLAQIADPESRKLLADVASRSKYVYEQTDATGAYILFLENSLNQGNRTMVATAARDLIRQARRSEQIAAKSAALSLFASASGENAISEINNALGSNDVRYRGAAFLAAAGIQSSQMTDALLRRARGARYPLKAEIITFFGVTDNKSALPFVLSTLNDRNPGVVAASVTTAGKLGQEQAVTPIVEAMKNGTQRVVDAGKNALLTIKSNQIASEAARGITGASVPATIAFIEVIAQKKATDYENLISGLTDSNNPEIALAATVALKDVVMEKDLPKLTGMLTRFSRPEQIAAVQEAIYAAVRYSGDVEHQTGLLLAQMENISDKTLFFKPLSFAGGEQALAIVSESFNSGDARTKEVAFNALTNWNGFEACHQLLTICRNDPSGAYFDRALQSYIGKIAPSQNTDPQKLLLLRDALDIARTPTQKESIIRQIARTGTFLGLVTAGKMMDDSNSGVQQAAVQAAITIALANPEFYGKVVTDILNKAMQLNRNSEAAYQREAILKHLAELPQDDGYVSMFNGKDLTGWKGLVDNPILRSRMTPEQLAQKQAEADIIMHRDWKVIDGVIVYEGDGYENLCSEKLYGDFELYVDWRIDDRGDTGLYLRGSPQVQIWDSSPRRARGQDVGSGGLFNNQINPSIPLVKVDNPVREWNSFYLRMIGEKVTIYLNGQLVTDEVILENFWNRAIPIFDTGEIELQAHTDRVEFRDIYVREIARPVAYEVSEEEKREGFVPLFNGINLDGWRVLNPDDYYVKDGLLICDPASYSNLYSDKEYSDFVVRLEFQLTPAANNGLGIRTKIENGRESRAMEIQILDDDAEVYRELNPYQYHGSVYGVIPAKRGSLKPLGEWNYQEVMIRGNQIIITLNGNVIVEGDLAAASNNFTSSMDGRSHSGLNNRAGHFGFLGHGAWVAFRNVRIKELK